MENQKNQKDLTDFLGLQKQAYSDWISGRSSSYKKYLPQIATYLDVDINTLVYPDANLQSQSTTHKDFNKIFFKYMAQSEEEKLQTIEYFNLSSQDKKHVDKYIQCMLNEREEI